MFGPHCMSPRYTVSCFGTTGCQCPGFYSQTVCLSPTLSPSQLTQLDHNQSEFSFQREAVHTELQTQTVWGSCPTFATGALMTTSRSHSLSVLQCPPPCHRNNNNTFLRVVIVKLWIHRIFWLLSFFRGGNKNSRSPSRTTTYWAIPSPVYLYTFLQHWLTTDWQCQLMFCLKPCFFLSRE